MLVEKAHGALRIAALDQAAADSGLRIGMALAEARSWLTSLRVGEADRSADRAFLLALAATCERFTPLVALRDGDGLILDVTGCAHLFGGESGLAREACRRLIGMGVTPRVAVASTPHAAWAFARFMHGGTIPPGDAESIARALPVTALEADAQTTIALTRAGFRTLGDLAERPSGVLVARFGAELVERLHRILGREDARITPLRPPPAIVAERYFPEPLAVVESLMAALARLAHHVADTLERRREGGRAFEVRFFRADGKVDAITVGTAHATRDPALLMRLVGLRIEALADPLDPGFGFDAIRLAVTRSEPLAERQQDFTGGGRDEEGERALAELTGRLIARFGDRNVLRFVARETHDPARAGGASPCLSPTPSSPWPAPEPGHPPLRPLTLFEHPHPIEAIAEVPDGPPLKFRWRRVLHEVARAEGPESIAPEWWREGKGSSAARDYYRVEVAAGYRFWLFREGQFEDPGLHPRWFLHGLFA